MPKKRRKLDQFLNQRKKNHEMVLAERTKLSKRFFRFAIGALLAFFLALQVNRPTWSYALGLGLLLVLLTVFGGLCLNRLRPGVFDRPASFHKFVLLVLVTVGLYRLVKPWSPFLVPLPMFAMVAAMAYSQYTALLSVLALAFFVGLTSPRIEVWPSQSDLPMILRIDFPLTLVVLVGAVTSVLGVKRVRKQSKPVVVGFYAGLTQALLIFGFEFMRPSFDFGDLGTPGRLWSILHDPAWGFAGGLISGGIVTCLLPPIERYFDVLTERRLLDLSDPSNDLLRVLRDRAPGTYQHTLGVLQLGSNAAEAIGGDRLLSEVGAYYHDVGKIVKPEYFVENMGQDKSIHDRLRPSMSKMIIVSHVKDGIDFAKEAKLPQKIIDMIPMHHGTTVVEYFYQKARRETVLAEEAPGDVEYRYPGPKPRFREAGILMLADMIEAIAKTEEDPNPARFRSMVHDQILKRLLDGQLDESDLTLNDLRVIEESFVRTLTTMYHNRIKYPGGEEPVHHEAVGHGPLWPPGTKASRRSQPV
jgi:hypothetical protein